MEPEKEKDKNLVHSFNPTNSSFFSGKLILFLIIAAVLGVTSGYFLTRSSSTVNSMKNSITASTVSKGTTEGSDDTKTFKDITEGVLKEGGIEGEGAFHLERPGGISQNVYLTSSIVDLSKYLNRKLKVWGSTQKAQYAGWLMDVGKIEVIE
ncbi:MAG TPA: hypothetical protein VFD45_03300 [Patescibacteria group bacterium]|nr:hypothetical protein [Patescibacteria group bacterium]